MIAIYSNNLVTGHYISTLNFFQTYQVYNSIEEYQFALADTKIAFVNHINSYILFESEQDRLKHTYNGWAFSNEIEQLKSHSDLLFAFDNELHPYHIDLVRQHQQPNVIWAVPGRFNDNMLADAKNVIVWNQHFNSMVEPYVRTKARYALKHLNYKGVKSQYFDALLGTPRAHRDIVHELISIHKLHNKVINTYMTDHLEQDEFLNKYEWEPDIELTDFPVSRVTDTVLYQGQHMALARILPVQVYNRSAYSIVAETGFSNLYSFFTEKTAKPIMARRLFVMFSGYKFLQNLHDLGFQTFGNVVDESYDLIYNNEVRWAAAFDQVIRLCNMDQAAVIEKILPALDHNYNLLMKTDWTQHLTSQLQLKIIDLTHDRIRHVQQQIKMVTNRI